MSIRLTVGFTTENTEDTENGTSGNGGNCERRERARRGEGEGEHLAKARPFGPEPPFGLNLRHDGHAGDAQLISLR